MLLSYCKSFSEDGVEFPAKNKTWDRKIVKNSIQAKQEKRYQITLFEAWFLLKNEKITLCN